MIVKYINENVDFFMDLKMKDYELKEFVQPLTSLKMKD